MEQQEQGEGEVAAVEKPGPSRRAQKRRRRKSNDTANAQKSSEDLGLEEEGGGEGEKKPRNRQLSVSSKMVANHVMRTRLLGSESDPLNLEGVGAGGGGEVEERGSSRPLSPVFGGGGQMVLPRPPLLQNPRDPLNLEGFLPQRRLTKTGGGGRGKRGGRKKAVSLSEDVGVGSCPRREGGAAGSRGRGGRGRGGGRGGRKRKNKKMDDGDGTASTGLAFEPPVFKPEDQRYHYGNYDMYYGYRCSSRGSVEVGDPRISLMRREWFEGKDCLDIGCNTGQITLAVAQQFSPRSITGIDIDHKLIRIANKNLFRQQIPAVTPDGRPFPSSFISSFPLLSAKIRSRGPRATTSPQPFPNNVSFSQENYVPSSEEEVGSAGPQYDVILALSLTKWVHLNWGDAGLRRMFRKMFRQLRPGGRLLLEPQPFSSYSRKKKLTPAIYKNYYSINFKPGQFQAYLMSSDVGFTEHKFLGVPHHKSEGFRRPLHMYVKSRTGEVGTGVGEGERDGGSREGGEGGGRKEGGECGEAGEGERESGGGEEMEAEAAGEEGARGGLVEGKTARKDEEMREKDSMGVSVEGERLKDCDSPGQQKAQRDRTGGHSVSEFC